MPRISVEEPLSRLPPSTQAPPKSATLNHPGAATSRDAGLTAARTTDLSRLLLLEAAEAAAAGHAGDALSRAQRRQY